MLQEKIGTDNIIFLPELSREGNALHDNRYLSHIIVGVRSKHTEIFAELFKESAINKNVPTLFTDSAEVYDLNTHQIIEGVGLTLALVSTITKTQDLVMAVIVCLNIPNSYQPTIRTFLKT